MSYDLKIFTRSSKIFDPFLTSYFSFPSTFQRNFNTDPVFPEYFHLLVVSFLKRKVA